MATNEQILQPTPYKRVELLYLREKNRMLMDITMSLKPDPDTNEGIDLFLDLTSIYTALSSAIDLVETVQDKIWEAQAENAYLKKEYLDLMEAHEKVVKRLDKLDENLR